MIKYSHDSPMVFYGQNYDVPMISPAVLGTLSLVEIATENGPWK